MKNYEVTLMATSYKKVEICAENERTAEGLAARMYHQTDMLNFTNEDVDELAVQATEIEKPVDKLAMSAKDRMYMSLLRFCMEQTAEFDEEESGRCWMKSIGTGTSILCFTGSLFLSAALRWTAPRKCLTPTAITACSV